jgi:hypothetical protein
MNLVRLTVKGSFNFNEGMSSASKRNILICGAVFLLALGIRFLSFQDSRHGLHKFQGGVSASYLLSAKYLVEGNYKEFLSDPDLLGHPPGYPILIAFFYKLFGPSETLVQAFQITCDAATTIIIFLLAIKLLSLGTAVLASLLVALCPQFVYTSFPILPDSLVVPLILLAIYLIAHSIERPNIIKLIMAGVLVGISCWFRANAMFLSLFLAMATLLLFDRKLRWRYASAILISTIVVISPITIKNWIVFREFIPLSIGAGQTLIEGIGDYDKEGKLGMPATDVGIMEMEAKTYNRPDYAVFLFGPDAIKRDKDRLKRAFSVIKANPIWFASVMLRRAGSMFRIFRAAPVSAHPAVTSELTIPSNKEPSSIVSPIEFVSKAEKISTQVQLSINPDESSFHIEGDESKWGYQVASQGILVQPKTDYLMRVPVVVKNGMMNIKIMNYDLKTELGSMDVYFDPGSKDKIEILRIPFVSGSFNQVRVLFANSGVRKIRSVVEVGTMNLFELGPASYLWTRYPRVLIRAFQLFFKTAIMLPFIFIGIVLLAIKRQYKTLLVLLIVPFYYLSVQSILHTEYRYVVVIHYFHFVIAGFALYQLGTYLIRWSQRFKQTHHNSTLA